jgi:phosphoglycerate dehydrogenase-like enzyme
MRPIFRSIPSALAEPRTPGIPSRRPRALCALEELALELIYGPDELSEIENRVDLIAPPLTHLSKVDHADLLEQAEILITGWGCPLLSEEFLDSTPNLEAIFYGSGALGPVITPAVWDRGIVVSSAYAANAIPVAEYTLSTILFSLKQGWQAIRATRELKQYRRSVHVTGASLRLIRISIWLKRGNWVWNW